MSQASNFAEQAKNARAIYEVIGDSGSTYIFYWFGDSSITVARRQATRNQIASAEFLMGKNVRRALDDCGLHDFDGTTYQKGTELLKRIHNAQ
jgi:hypothetical protein